MVRKRVPGKGSDTLAFYKRSCIRVEGDGNRVVGLLRAGWGVLLWCGLPFFGRVCLVAVLASSVLCLMY